MHPRLALAAALPIAVAARERQATLQWDGDGLMANSPLGRALLSRSRRVEQAAAYASDISFVANYAIKFQGCHHVTQWATDKEIAQAEEEDANAGVYGGAAPNNRIRSKGLVRFRLCPAEKCTDRFKTGCTAGYGEYVVDMTSFLQAYVAWKAEATAYNCGKYSDTCFAECYESASASCYQKCYNKYGVDAALCSSSSQNSGYDADAYESYDAYAAASAYGDNQFDLQDYLECGEIEVGTGDEAAHYLGPYCADQGGDIKLGFFQDRTCSTPSSFQASYYEKKTGVEIPYTKTSIVDTNCLSCTSTAEEQEAQGNKDYYNYDADGNRNYYIAKSVNDLCAAAYVTAGKCESQLDPDDQPYPEEGACTYLQGIRQLQGDGILRSDQKQRSKPAAVAIWVFTGAAALLGGYIYHLKGVIARSAVDLAGGEAALA